MVLRPTSSHTDILLRRLPLPPITWLNMLRHVSPPVGSHVINCTFIALNISIAPRHKLPNAKLILRNEEKFHFHSNNHFTQAIKVSTASFAVFAYVHLWTPAAFICISFPFCCGERNIKTNSWLSERFQMRVCYCCFLHCMFCVSNCAQLYFFIFPTDS